MSKVLEFPSTLRAEVDNGGHHVSFQILGKTDLNQLVDKIHLYVPGGFSLGDGAEFGNINLGTINALKSLGDTKKTASEVEGSQDAESLAIGAALLQKLGADDMGGVGAVMEQRGVAVNNATTMTYTGPNIRTFELSFDLVPSSAKEAEMARIIEHTFRKYMYPKDAGYALMYPPVFRIKFMTGKNINKFMPFLYDSYLTGMTTSYNNSGNMYHADGSPTDIKIALSFSEQKMLTRGDLYELDDVPADKIQQTFDYPQAPSSEAPQGG